MGKRTPFYESHVQSNAKIVDFAGWEMPLHYGSQLDEHHCIRADVGMFDVSHMGVVDLQGPGVLAFLRKLLANNIDRIQAGKALYTCMLNEAGGVMDDLIVYRLQDDHARIVINAGRREPDLAWMKVQAAPFDVATTLRTEVAMLAIQGPKAAEKLVQLMALCGKAATASAACLSLKPFTFVNVADWFVARTGYTGEDGYEIILPATAAASLWQSALQVGISPCGLGARDTLRLEAGLNLYGQDMDETVTPFESNLGWTVALDPKERDFIGRAALEAKAAQQENAFRLVGLVLVGSGIIRHHQRVLFSAQETSDTALAGKVTSGGYSPTLEKSIALARIPQSVKGEDCFVEIRNKLIPAKIVRPPFIKQGKKLV